MGHAEGLPDLFSRVDKKIGCFYKYGQAGNKNDNPS
jgi:hypothetical protein